MTRAELALLNGTSTSIVAEILAERRRQIAVEGWTPKHDERHPFSELALAASAYALAGAAKATSVSAPGIIEAHAAAWWPWEPETFKPKDSRRDLVRAGALLVAALERLDRDAELGSLDAP